MGDSWQASALNELANDERDEYIEKFRKLEIQVIVATDMLARGFHVPEL